MKNNFYKPFQTWGEKGSIWLYSDPHFDDEELAVAFARPTSEDLVRRINSKVGKNDAFICLGDVGNKEWVKKIRGYKILICGNHDGGGSNYTDVFDEVYTGPLIISSNIILSHEPLPMDWIFNIHGHNHNTTHNSPGHWNCCADVIAYDPININVIIKSGRLKEIKSIHRQIIDNATERKRK